MLISEFYPIGNRLLSIRKRMGLTQAEVAEAAGLSERTYAEIERCKVNMRIETALRICKVLHITPNDLLITETPSSTIRQKELFARLNACNQKDKDTALRLLEVYLESLT